MAEISYYLEALLKERSKHLRMGLPDRVAAVDAELARLGYAIEDAAVDDDPKSEGDPKSEEAQSDGDSTTDPESESGLSELADEQGAQQEPNDGHSAGIGADEQGAADVAVVRNEKKRSSRKSK